jgi:phosphopantothenoylcysteine decarboxylase/phosphopantothenate--cysteine ligase
LNGKLVVVGVTGGNAAYKAAETRSASLRSMVPTSWAMTEGATQFVTRPPFRRCPQAGQCRPGTPVANAMAHIDMCASRPDRRRAGRPISWRASAGPGRRPAATRGWQPDSPLLVAPAMNRQMWENP